MIDTKQILKVTNTHLSQLHARVSNLVKKTRHGVLFHGCWRRRRILEIVIITDSRKQINTHNMQRQISLASYKSSVPLQWLLLVAAEGGRHHPDHSPLVEVVEVVPNRHHQSCCSEVVAAEAGRRPLRNPRSFLVVVGAEGRQLARSGKSAAKARVQRVRPRNPPQEGDPAALCFGRAMARSTRSPRLRSCSRQCQRVAGSQAASWKDLRSRQATGGNRS